MVKLLLNNLKSVFAVLVTAIVVFAVTKALTPKPTTTVKPVTVVIHDTVQINQYIKTVLHDTTHEPLTIFQKIVEKQMVPETVVTYVPISVKDSSAFARIFLMNKISMTDGELSVDAVNLSTRNYQHQTFSLDYPNYDLTTNAEGISLLEHRTWIAWNGIDLGGRYTFPGGCLLAQTGITILRHVELEGVFTTNQHPWEINLSYKVIR